LSDVLRDEPFPRAPLFAAAALVAFAIIAVAWVRLTGIGAAHVPDEPAVSVRELRFEDRPDGGVAVYDVQSNELVKVITGSNGFLRGTLRGLARERKRSGFGPDQAFRLVAHADGRLTLEDPATARRVDLESFGPTNVAVFAQLMQPGSSTR
jgi:putative photosynthetic complex assembly protein